MLYVISALYVERNMRPILRTVYVAVMDNESSRIDVGGNVLCMCTSGAKFLHVHEEYSNSEAIQKTSYPFKLKIQRRHDLSSSSILFECDLDGGIGILEREPLLLYCWHAASSLQSLRKRMVENTVQ
jgi:hypothetical protein